MCVTGHQSSLDPCTAAGESGRCQAALGERKAQYGSDGVRCTRGWVCTVCVRRCACKWMHVRCWWAILVVVVGVTAGCLICSFGIKCRPVLQDRGSTTTTTTTAISALIHPLCSFLLFASFYIFDSIFTSLHLLSFLQIYSIYISVPFYFHLLICHLYIIQLLRDSYHQLCAYVCACVRVWDLVLLSLWGTNDSEENTETENIFLVLT